jgi:mono/diheme cytochrome c family protein
MSNNSWALAACAAAALFLGASAVGADKAKAAGPAEKGASDSARGKLVFAQWCQGCHAPMGGPGGAFGFPPAGTNRLQQRYQGAVPAALEDRNDLNPELIRTAVRQGLPIMPPLRKTEVTDADLDAVIAYLTQKKNR